MFQSHIIEVSGVFVGAAVRTSERLRFIAVDPRVEELDHSEWKSLADVRRVVGHLVRTGRLPPIAIADDSAAVSQHGLVIPPVRDHSTLPTNPF